MAEAPVRVALLARPGTACENLQVALRQAGAEVVLVADPLGSDAGSVSAAAPGAVLVALEPAVEDVLDRYDPVLLDPAMNVIYDEAELAAKREGWDAARWTRHLAAKLAGHDDVLPPGAGTEAPAPPPVEAAEPVQEPAPVHEPAPVQESGPMTAEAPPALEVVPDGELELDALEFDGDLGGFELPEPELATGPEPEASLEPEPAPEAEAPAEPAPEPEPEPAATSDLKSLFANLSLEEVAEPAGTAGGSGGSAAGNGGSQGGVVVLSGLGGPDAVRQFLSELPPGFSRPVLVRQRLDGARHDRLVRQLQRATPLPVELAEPGKSLVASHVYILPDGVAAELADDTGARFVAAADPVPPLAGLSPAESAVLLLSGSDPSLVDAVLAAQAQGAYVAGQSPEDCFDSEASAALVARGGASGSPAELAGQVATRWLSLES